MSKFKITYTSGLVEEVETSEAGTVEQFVNIKFGVDLAAVTECGTVIELLDVTGEPVAVVEPTETTEPVAP